MDPFMDELGGFSMAKIMLSNALPRSVYDPCLEADEDGEPHESGPIIPFPPPSA